jgi:hypothetical protein
MNTQQQAYIYGFVKRAAEYGFSENEALNILKNASELKGDQYKLDVDHDGKIEASDLKKLRQRKKAEDASPAAPTMNERITRFLGINNPNVQGTPKSKPGAYGGVMGKPVTSGTSGVVQAPGVGAVRPVARP